MSGTIWKIGRLTRRRSNGSTYTSYTIKWADTGGTRHRVSLDTADKAAAPAKAREYWARLTRSTAGTVGEVMTAYLNSLGGTKDEKRKREAWAAASPFWGNLALSQIDERTSGEYMEWRKRALNTLRNELGPIRTALNWALKNKSIDSAPRITLPVSPPSAIGHLTKPEFARFLTECRAPHVALFAQLAVTTGARPMAVLEMTWAQIDWDRHIVNLNQPGREQSNKRRPVVPLNDRIYPLLVEAKEGAQSEYVIELGGLPMKSIKMGIAAAAKRSGIHCSPNMFRHSAAVWMAEDRVPMAEISQYLGHTNVNITSRVYAKFSPDYLRLASKSLDW